MKGYVVPLSCAKCGGELKHVTAGRPVAGTTASAVARCVGCGGDWQVMVRLLVVPSPETERRREEKRRERARQRERAMEVVS